eukprot:3971684-Prymnesium_polylepis.2
MRQRAPKGVPLKAELTDAEFAKMPTALDSMLATGDELTGDLVELEDVTEYTMLHTLRERYEQDLIYTAIGPPARSPRARITVPPAVHSRDAAPRTTVGCAARARLRRPGPRLDQPIQGRQHLLARCA